MRTSLSIILVIVFCLCLNNATLALASSLSMSKPGCPEKCGNITIPYPFGVGSKCSSNSYFLIICQNLTNPPTLFLPSINMEATDISIDYGTIVVKNPISPMKCTNEQETTSVGKSLLGSPFSISADRNTFAVVGCKNLVFLRYSDESYFDGCMPVCRNSDHPKDDYCNGVNCCQTSFLPQIKELRYSYQSIKAEDTSFCGYAFPVDKTWFEKAGYVLLYQGLLDNITNTSGGLLVYMHLVLDWPLYDRENYIWYQICDFLLFFVRPPAVAILLSLRLGAVLLVLSPFAARRLILKRIKAYERRKLFKRNGGLLLEQKLSTTDNGYKKTKLFSSNELLHATDFYSENRVLGRGGQGTVYKGMLTDGRIVAVKKSKKLDESDIEDFVNEILILSQINHRNIVKLLGCCLENEIPLLVYEFIPNGTLCQQLHDPNEDFILSWEMRVRIATEIASALSYLHSATSAPIYHRDIKSTNILLDERYRAKISDFGTSRSVGIDQTHLTTRVLGTFGYLDPEYFESSQFTEKSDVYSFGVVMVELLTGEKAISALRDEMERGLAAYFLHSMEEDKLFDIVDPRIFEEGKDTEEIEVVAELARKCLNMNGKSRPTMKQVATKLESIRKEERSALLEQNLDLYGVSYGSIVPIESYDCSSLPSITLER